MTIKEPYRILFLLFLVLGVYYPSLFAGINSVDDWRMFVDLRNTESIDLRQLFLPNTGFYYRPLLMLSFLMDKFLWGLEPSFMHLENVLLHACNTLLVYSIAKQFFLEQERVYLEPPLLASVLFALHPINTESVNWISGRTDLLGTFFILLSTYLLIQSVAKRKVSFVVLSSLCLLLGMMSKEIMLFFFPVGCVLLYLWPSMHFPPLSDRRPRLLFIFIFSLPFIAGAVLYLFVRSLLFSQNDHGVHHLAQFHQFVSFKMVGSLFKVFGFYIKKLFIPIPLNFAITTIGSQYLWIGIGSFFIALFLLTKKLVSPTFLFIALYLITPAAIIAIANVAWTPIAERYLYLSSTFWAIWLSCLVYWLFAFGRKTQVATFAVVAFVLCSFTIFTSIRNLQWQDNVELYKDTFLQNPNFTAINNEYAIALIDSGKYSEAETILTEGINNQDNKNELLYINLARLKVKQEKFDEARQLLITSFSDKEHAHPEVLKMIADVDEKRLFVGRYNDEEERRKIIHELIDTYSVVYKMQNNPFFLYRSGQLALSVGLWVEARAAFARAYEEAPAEAYYKKAAGKLALKLEQQ